MLPIPDSVISKIRRLEFLDMADLRPEAWMFKDEPHKKSLAGLFKRQKQPVTNILLWVQCFTSYVAVLSQTQPQSMPHQMAYMATIIRCHIKFEGLGWVVYDSAYRHQATRQRDLNWAVLTAHCLTHSSQAELRHHLSAHTVSAKTTQWMNAQ